jgi:hypothetical protein
LSWSKLVLGLQHNDGVVVAVGDEEPVVDDHLGAALLDLTQAWMEGRVGRRRGGLGVGGGYPVEGWVQEAVLGRWRAGWASTMREGELWVGGGEPVQGWVVGARNLGGEG